MNKNYQAESAQVEKAVERLMQRPGFLLRRVLQQSSAVFEERCRDLGMTVPQYYYLYLLDQVPEVGQGEISQMLGMDRSTNTLVLKILERKGWVKRTVDADDTRRRTVRITKEGKAVFGKTSTAGEQAIDVISGGLTPNQYRVLIELLQKIVHHNE